MMFFLIVLAAAVVAVDPSWGLEQQHHEYCIIGAGPGGLQLAYFLHKAKRDYVVFEKAAHAGAFFDEYPRHRRLISINKRNTGEKNTKFNLRHDWNSLLSDDDRMRFTHRSKQLFPSADLMTEYLDDFHRFYNLHVQLNTTIQNLRSVSPEQRTCDSNSCSFSSIKEEKKRFRMNDQLSNRYTCGIVIVATGLFIPNVPSMAGIDIADGYENLSLNVTEFENQSVLILGRGNAAFEVAQHIYDATNFIHMISRSRVRNAYATHYVGDLRAINNQFLDTYQLKSLDALIETDLLEHELHRREIDGRIQLVARQTQSGTFSPVRGNSAVYDRVIRCLGFKFDDSIWHPEIAMNKNPGRTGKFPKINYDYQSVDIDHLYFAGTITHSLDFRKSSGGFIHGFRYTTRALHRILDSRYHSVPWASTIVPWHALTNYIIKRMNEADGIYQMFGQLVDVLLIDRANRQCRYFEEFPTRLLPRLGEITGFESNQILVLNMQYGMNYSGPGRDVFAFGRTSATVNTADRSNFLHPVLYYYDSPLKESDFDHVKIGYLPSTPAVRMHHVIENLLTLWMQPDEHILPLRIFLENILQIGLQQRTIASYVRERMLNRKTLDIVHRKQSMFAAA